MCLCRAVEISRVWGIRPSGVKWEGRGMTGYGGQIVWQMLIVHSNQFLCGRTLQMVLRYRESIERSFHPESGICQVCSWCESLRDVKIWKRKITMQWCATKLLYFYRPQTKLREGNVLHLSVSHSVHRAGVSAPVHAGIHHHHYYPRHTPPGQTPPSHCCGRYASYWNAFLFNLLIWLGHLVNCTNQLVDCLKISKQHDWKLNVLHVCLALLIRRCASRHLEGSNSYRLLSRRL